MSETRELQFRKKPVVVEAIRWTGENVKAVMDFMHWRNAEHDNVRGLTIRTLEGTHHASPGDWIIKGVQGEFYPCKPDIFAATYEAALSAPSSPGDGWEPRPSTGGQATIIDGKIEISIDVAALPMIVNGSCHCGSMDGLWKVTNAETFAKEVCRALNDEGEVGTTRVHTMFYAAFMEAINQDAEGIEEVDEEAFSDETVLVTTWPLSGRRRSDD